MPELPEAETVARQLRTRLVGAVITDVRVGRDDIVREGLVVVPWYRGSRLVSVRRVGKTVVLGCEKGGETRHMLFELGMTGLLFFTLLHPSYQKHTHLTLSLSGPFPALHYWNPRRFGRVYCLDSEGLRAFVTRRFGCDPLDVTWEQFRDVIHRRRGRVKALLMHQPVIAGIGNSYANEILYRARLHPDRVASRLRVAAVAILYRVMREVLTEAIQAGGSSVRDFLAPDGTKGDYRKHHQVYNKSGVLCPSGCGKTIRRLKGERTSFICPSCQRT